MLVNVKRTFAFFLASCTLAVSLVSAGSVRGVWKDAEDVVAEAANGIEIAGVHRRRNLKNENKNNKLGGGSGSSNNNNNPVPVPVTTPAPFPLPVPMRASSGLQLWRETCDLGNLRNCAGGGAMAGCTQCLYAQSVLVSSSQAGINNCARFLCNKCTDEALAFYGCGTGAATTVVVASTTPPPVSVPVAVAPVPAVPPPVPAVVVGVALPQPQPEPQNTESDYTSSGCPATKPSNGGDCEGMIPSPFLYHRCVYPTHTCTCRTDSPYYLCTVNPAGAVPVPPPPAPVPVVSPPISAPVSVTVPAPVPAPVSAPVPMVSVPVAVVVPAPIRDSIPVSLSVDPPVSAPVGAVASPPDVGIPIPGNVDFSLASAWCPAKINNCEPCTLPEDKFEGSCGATTNVEYEGASYLAQIQCRCYLQNNPNPFWQCRYVGGTLGTVLIPVAPACDPATRPGTGINILPETGGSSDNIVTNIITEIPKTKVCLSRLPTSGLTSCDLAPDAICCHNVQIGIATVCTCVNQKFQCVQGVPSDCPDDQNPNVVPPL